MYDRHILFKEHLPNKIFKKILSFYKSPNYNKHCIICYAKNVSPNTSYAYLYEYKYIYESMRNRI